MTQQRNKRGLWRHRFLTVLVTLAMFVHGGLSPLTALAAAGLGGELSEWVEICTGTGTKLVQLPAGEQDQPASQGAGEDCGACVCGGCGCSGGSKCGWSRVVYPAAGEFSWMSWPRAPAHLTIVAANLSRGPPLS